MKFVLICLASAVFAVLTVLMALGFAGFLNWLNPHPRHWLSPTAQRERAAAISSRGLPDWWKLVKVRYVGSEQKWEYEVRARSGRMWLVFVTDVRRNDRAAATLIQKWMNEQHIAPAHLVEL